MCDFADEKSSSVGHFGKIGGCRCLSAGKIESLSGEVVMCFLLLRSLGVVSQVPLLRRHQLSFAEGFLVAGIPD